MNIGHIIDNMFNDMKWRLIETYGIDATQAACYMCNFLDDKHCDGCPSLDICRMIREKEEAYDEAVESD